MNEIPEPLRNILNDYCHVEWLDEMNELNKDLSSKDWAYNAGLFKTQLRDSINNLSFSLSDYEEVTNHDFDSEDELVNWLKTIWETAFPDEPI